MVSLFQQLQNFFSTQPSFPTDLLSFLPHSYKRVGHVALINLPDTLIPFKELIGQQLLSFLHPSIRTVARFVKSIDGVTRQPTVEWLAGDTNFETVHTEHGTKFVLNPSELMLSAGNHYERKRLIEFVHALADQDLVILDMFACIGNLTLPLINHTSSTKFIFLEINPIAVQYLRKSLIKNKIDPSRYSIFEGDNRLTCPSDVADIVVMGYFGIDLTQLQCALASLNTKRSECWLFIHDTGFLDAESKVMSLFSSLLASHSTWKLDSVTKNIVKSIGPGVQHWVFDCHLLNLHTQP